MFGSNIVFTTAPDAALEFSGVSLGPAVPISYANDGVIYVRNTYSATAGQTVFTFAQGYTVGYLDVYRNGVRLSSGTDFTATNGSTFTLASGATLNDEIEAIGYSITSLVYTNSLFTNINVTGIGTINTLNVAGTSTLGIVTGATYYGNGANLTGVISGVQIREEGSPVGSAITSINFVGSDITATASGAGATVTVSVAIPAGFNELDSALFN